MLRASSTRDIEARSKVIVVNLDPASPIDIKRGDKIAQLVVQAVETVELEAVEELPESERGEGGFGSTGR